MTLLTKILEKEKEIHRVQEKVSNELYTLLQGTEELILQTRDVLKEQAHTDTSDSERETGITGYVESFDSQTDVIITESQTKNEEDVSISFLFLIHQTAEQTMIKCYQLYSDWSHDLTHECTEELIIQSPLYTLFTDVPDYKQTNWHINLFDIKRPNLPVFEEHYQELLVNDSFGFQALFSITSLDKNNEGKCEPVYNIKHPTANYESICSALYFLTGAVK